MLSSECIEFDRHFGLISSIFECGKGTVTTSEDRDSSSKAVSQSSLFASSKSSKEALHAHQCSFQTTISR